MTFPASMPSDYKEELRDEDVGSHVAAQWLRTQALHNMSGTEIMMPNEIILAQKKWYILIPIMNLHLKMCALGWQDS